MLPKHLQSNERGGDYANIDEGRGRNYNRNSILNKSYEPSSMERSDDSLPEVGSVIKPEKDSSSLPRQPDMNSPLKRRDVFATQEKGGFRRALGQTGGVEKYTRNKLNQIPGQNTSQPKKHLQLSLKKRNYETLRDNLANQQAQKVKLGPRAKKDGNYLN